jgi:16S rRNA (uracil1498-N3)-methyltransferase
VRPPTTGPHVFAAPEGSEVRLAGDEAHHLTRVLRLRPGDPVSVSDGQGTVYQAEVSAVATGAVTLSLGERWEVPVSTPFVTVVHALPKARKLDDVVQRLSELGVDRLVPAQSERSEVRLDEAKAMKVAGRWRAVALAAAKQSRRARPMEVADISGWADAFSEVEAGVIFWEESTTPARVVLEGLGGHAAIVLGIGPEGGLTAEEVTAGGLPTASLGDTVLRTETAALVAASIVLHHLGRIG